MVFNPTVAELYEHAMHPAHKHSFDPLVADAAITSTGALCAYSGERTGRSPIDKRVVYDEITRDTVWWGKVNIPISPLGYARNRQRAIDFLNIRPNVFIVDGYAGWDPDYKVKVRVICSRPYHALFMKQMLMRAPTPQLVKDFQKGIDFTILNAGEFTADTLTEDVTNQTSVAVNFREKELTILGTQYAGEMKKGVFGVMHFLMPMRGALSMHASANEGPNGDTTILFGLSGTGKTTLSADPKRALIGDDEHVWTNKGVFNIEGGCYAKVVGLSREKEPEIFDAIRFGSVVENIKFEESNARTIAFNDTSLTENTRVCYPLEYIDGAKIPAIGGHPKNMIFLTCDANGVLPPVARLTKEQTMYHFISGYTAKVAGTEMGVKNPEPSFSACFGEAFLPLHPYTYAELLAKYVEKYRCRVWLINTGWTGGKYGVGERMSLKHTRSIIDALHEGKLDGANYANMPVFNLAIPTEVPGVPTDCLQPRLTWDDKEEYDAQLLRLAKQFSENFKTYEDGTPNEVIQKGGPTTN